MNSEFVVRHNGLTAADEQEMLQAIGFSSLEEMTAAIVPADIRLTQPLDLPAPLCEQEALSTLKSILSENSTVTSLIGQGFYGTFMPPVIQRNVLENPSWYTAYTPYQPEIAQGRLEMLINFQSMICDLTGLPVANSSMLDEATSAGEAMILAKNNKPKGDCLFVADSCYPATIDHIRTRCETQAIRLIVGDWKSFDPSSEPGLCGVLVQYPDGLGSIEDYSEFFTAAKAQKALCIVAADLLALTQLKEPASFGADLCVGSTQRFGIPMGYGGPAAGYMACTDALKRKVPGRFVGLSIDADGKPAYRLALQTREQHIRREKATSNICTAQVLMAILATFYAMYQGPEGLRAEAKMIHSLAKSLATSIAKSSNMSVVNANYFDTIVIRREGQASELVAAALEAGYNIYRVNDDCVSIAMDSNSSHKDVSALCAAFGIESSVGADGESSSWDVKFNRESNFCEQKCFNKYHSETEMMRAIRHMESKDLALNEAMIPLGSCTMKANCASIMTPITWPELGNLHPYAPKNQCVGVLKMLKQAEAWLAVVTGSCSTSLQALSGAAGEYNSLLTIHRYQVAQGEGHRNVCLIPASAHGTNPASATMAGWKTIVVKCDEMGNIDMQDMQAKAIQYKDSLAAVMVTYPSTHGVYEEGIKGLCEMIHANGGQVFMDGANMNAQVALTNPGFIGADVTHLNLHKSFALPHGGGGPGVGPICCAAHLAPYLPGHVVQGGAQTQSAVASAEYGNATLNAIVWMYLAMMGDAGLKRASQLAILSANYVAKQLADCFPVLYTGKNGYVAHECILNTKPALVKSGIAINDMAKRLMDYGFHAPTMSFPVVNTFMVEPTESESKTELDRFITAMRMIHAEMEAVAAGEVPIDNNVLVNAPHTAAACCADEWSHPYSRSEAAYPVDGLKLHKFWPACSRISDSYGDRNFCSSCDTIAAAENCLSQS